MFTVRVYGRKWGESPDTVTPPVFEAVLPDRRALRGLGEAIGGEWLSRRLDAFDEIDDEDDNRIFYAANFYWKVTEV